jgi:hypothetical protein
MCGIVLSRLPPRYGHARLAGLAMGPGPRGATDAWTNGDQFQRLDMPAVRERLDHGVR